MPTLHDAIIENLNFAHDARNCAPDSAPMLYMPQPDGSVLEVTLPTTWGVCDVCHGAGTHVNPAIDCGGISSQEFDEDPDFADSYRRGDYDQTCNKCAGRTTVRVVDMSRLTPEQRKAYTKQLREEADDRAEHLAEIRMGA